MAPEALGASLLVAGRLEVEDGGGWCKVPPSLGLGDVKQERMRTLRQDRGSG